MKKLKKKIKNVINHIFYRPKIKGAKGNKINIPWSASLRRVKIEIYGNNNTVEIGENVYLHNSCIKIGFKSHHISNATVKIGKNSGFNSLIIEMGESNSIVEIGEDCMFSYDIEIYCTDQHSIFDENNNILNIAQSVIIGNHVWAAKEVRIMKNTKVPDGCVIGQRSMVTRKFDKPNCVIAGNPAKIVKENIHWTKDRPDLFIK